MKYYLLLICTLCSFSLHANELVNGYIVMANQDTIQTSIKIAGRAPITNSQILVTVDDARGEQLFQAADKQVLGYGFKLNQVSYSFRFFDIQRSFGSAFFRLIENGDNFLLYENKVKGIDRTAEVPNSHYVLMKSSGETINFTTALFSNWKKVVKEFVWDNPEALKALSDLKRNEVPAFVRFLNNM
ncbi:hypothetical protein [Mongoliitalea daihaiensis]|uniref:hypothetical protein n=1 Tax=Mongoliitalea daihaiensis TaxID=2782006 RepID=UPI001F404D2F|nr:hypothetical protein [Mongoliitalea daihaiensis]UJP63791.1 hypothetical protein IPZ59_13250 [Mongoliitalea daihaiensis]